MIENRCAEHLTAVQAFADTLPQKTSGGAFPERYKMPRQSLDDAVGRFADDDNKRVVLMKEAHVPHSFYFHLYTLVGPTDKAESHGLPGRGGENYVKDGKEWRFFYDGGIIFADYNNNWNIHT